MLCISQYRLHKPIPIISNGLCQYRAAALGTGSLVSTFYEDQYDFSFEFQNQYNFHFDFQNQYDFSFDFQNRYDFSI